MSSLCGSWLYSREIRNDQLLGNLNFVGVQMNFKYREWMNLEVAHFYFYFPVFKNCMFFLHWVRCHLFLRFIQHDKLDTIVRLIISVFEDRSMLFTSMSSEVLRPPLKNYQLASPLQCHHKLNHCHCICHPCPTSCFEIKKHSGLTFIWTLHALSFSFSAVFPKENIIKIEVWGEMI